MTIVTAIAFLEAHQPLPPTEQIDDALLAEYDEVRKFCSKHRERRLIPLLLNSFGAGDGHGVYQLVEDVITMYPEEVVIPALIEALMSNAGSVRYWNAQIAANYQRPELIEPLSHVLNLGNSDERVAAAVALRRIGTPDAISTLRAVIQSEDWDEADKQFVVELLEDLEP